MRYVPEEEDQMRWQDALMHPLPKLQDRVCLHTSREETEPAEGVSADTSVVNQSILKDCSAKYIEGLENRLGRMESLLRLSGLLAEDESGEMDLGTLERKLSEKKEQLQNERKASPTEKGSPTGSEVNEGSVEAEEQEKEEGDEERQTDESKPKRKGGEVEALSDMMCSLVTNNSGETRYIGKLS